MALPRGRPKKNPEQSSTPSNGQTNGAPAAKQTSAGKHSDGQSNDDDSHEQSVVPETSADVVSDAVIAGVDIGHNDVDMADDDGNAELFAEPTPISRITLLTGNDKKLDELKKALGVDFPIKLEARNINLPELQGASCEAVVREKCRQACRALQPRHDEAILCDDTGLCFNAMGGLPGSYVKWFIKANNGPAGLYQMLHGFGGDYSAYAQSVFAFYCASPPRRYIAKTKEKLEKPVARSCTSCDRLTYDDADSSILLFDGRCDGTIVSPRGSKETGWDACFQPALENDLFDSDGYPRLKTYAEMTPEEKSECSQRTRAVENLKRFLLTNYCAKQKK